MTVIDGKAVSERVKDEIAAEIARICPPPARKPGLAVILVGEDPASQVYVRNKKRACELCGIKSFEYLLSADEPVEKLLEIIESLNRDEAVDGILVQMPLPKHMPPQRVTESIDPRKDVDGFHSQNVGLLQMGAPRFAPCTPRGVMRLLKEYDIDPAGKNCLVVGRSNIVGKPMAALLLAANGTVTVAHSKTPDIASHCRRADLIVAACGRPGMITGDMIREGAVLIDVGITRVDGKLKGDFDFDSCAEKTAAITPVPGGVGPMTIAMLMENTLISYKNRMGL